MKHSFKQLDKAFLSHFARRLADLINEQGSQLLSGLELTTPTTFVSSLLYLYSIKECTAKELADALSVTHQMATQRINTLIKLELIQKQTNSKDRRSQILVLTDKGLEEARLLVQVTDQVAKVFMELDEEITCNLQQAIIDTEDLLRKRTLLERINEKQLNKNIKE